MIYDYPEYYEVAFSFRNYQQEADFIKKVINKYSTIPVKNILELACGNAPHAEQIISSGYNYTGLDLNRNMLDHAHYKHKLLSQKPKFVEGDMVKFELAEKIDFAFVLLGSLYLNTMDEIDSHFDSVSRVLNKGGLYFLDWCIQFEDPLASKDNNEYSIEKNGITVNSRFDIKMIDFRNQMYEEVWTINVDDHGRHKQFEMIERNKAILPGEFLYFIKQRSDFEFVEWWNGWDLNKPIANDEQVLRPVALIRKI